MAIDVSKMRDAAFVASVITMRTAPRDVQWILLAWQLRRLGLR